MATAMKPPLQNLVRGRLVGANTFTATSPYFPDYSVQIADASEQDLERAISLTKRGQERLGGLSFDERAHILKDAAGRLVFDESDIEHAVRMMGMPRKSIKDYVEMIPMLMAGMPDTVAARYDVIDGKLGHRYDRIDSIELKEAKDGPLYAVVPSNDPRATLFVFSFCAVRGIPAVFKVSKAELPIATKVVQAALDAGYPPEGISLLCWDTSDAERAKRLHFKLADAANQVVIFGSDETVDNTLRYERRRIIVPEKLQAYRGQTLTDEILASVTEDQPIDHLDGKLMRHTTGNCAMIVTEDADLEHTVRTIIHSAYHYPISCKSLKAIYAIGKAYDRLVAALPTRMQELLIGDPLNPRVDVGYVEPDTLDAVLHQMENLRRVGQVQVLAGGERVNRHQATPLLVATQDPLALGLTKEISLYIATIKRCGTLNEAVDHCNQGAHPNRLAVSVMTGSNLRLLVPIIANLKANLIHVNQPTNYLHGVIHQGYNYIEALGWSKSIKL